MCYGDTITIEVGALNHGITDLNNATQVIEAVAEGRAVARVISVEHWTDPCCGAIADPGLFALLHTLAPFLAVATLITLVLFAFLIWAREEQENNEEGP
ncbi:MAG: hypothetical protein WC343_08250 [Bacilli bacterium]|jgi:hypothetical protein